jgi:hypothetical protein
MGSVASIQWQFPPPRADWRGGGWPRTFNSKPRWHALDLPVEGSAGLLFRRSRRAGEGWRRTEVSGLNRFPSGRLAEREGFEPSVGI